MEYYRHRERQARMLADEATMPQVAEIHREMAERYAALALEAAIAGSRAYLRVAHALSGEPAFQARSDAARSNFLAAAATL